MSLLSPIFELAQEASEYLSVFGVNLVMGEEEEGRLAVEVLDEDGSVENNVFLEAVPGGCAIFDHHGNHIVTVVPALPSAVGAILYAGEV